MMAVLRYANGTSSVGRRHEGFIDGVSASVGDGCAVNAPRYGVRYGAGCGAGYGAGYGARYGSVEDATLTVGTGSARNASAMAERG